jgi:hypothetical protein
MKTYSTSSPAYEAPQAELLEVFVEKNLLTSQTGRGGGQNVTMLDEEDFDSYFNN